MSEPDKRLGRIETLREVKTDFTSDINTSISLATESVDTNRGKRRHLRFVFSTPINAAKAQAQEKQTDSFHFFLCLNLHCVN